MLILSGLLLAGYASFHQISAFDSPMSAREHTLVTLAHQGAVNGYGEMTKFFREIMGKLKSGWNPVIVVGLLISVAACFIKTGSSRKD